MLLNEKSENLPAGLIHATGGLLLGLDYSTKKLDLSNKLIGLVGQPTVTAK